MVSIRMPSCNSPRPATSKASFSVDSLIRSATLPSASRSSRSRITRLCTLSPSLPASGESLMRNVIAKRRRIDRLRRQRLRHLRRAERVRHGRLRQPGDGDDVAGLGLLDGGALEAAEGQHLGDAALLDQLAVAVEHLDGLVGLDRARA